MQDASHVLFEVTFDDFPDELEDLDVWKKIGKTALDVGKFTVHHEHFHKFEPHGASGFWLLSESHLSFHVCVPV